MKLWRIWAKAPGGKGLCRQDRSRPDRAHQDPDCWRPFHHLLFHHGQYDPSLVAPETGVVC